MNRAVIQITCDLCAHTISTDGDYHPQSWLNIRIETYGKLPSESEIYRKMARGNSTSHYCPNCVSKHNINELISISAKIDVEHGSK